MRVFVCISILRYTGKGVSRLGPCVIDSILVLCRRRAWLLNMRSCEIVRVGVDADEWPDYSWIVVPFRIIATNARREFGTDCS